ncbi:hypothetical protein KJ940_14165, partial [Myxococcota bacterium]|nr:hypothetical protein [Myxococcota bacterium]
MIRELNNPEIEAQLEDAARAWAQIQEMRQRRAAPAPTPATPSAKRAKAESQWTKSLDAAIESFERVREELRSRRPPTPAGPPDTPDAAWPAHPIEEHFKLSSTNPYDPAATLQAHSLLTCTRCDDGMVQEVDERGYRFLVPCRCQPWTRHADRLNRAALPAAALYNDLKTMDFTRVRSRRHIPQGQVASGPRNLSDLQMEITRVLAGATRAATDGRQSWRAGLLLYGKTGVGKTHVLHALARKLTLESGQSLTWLHWPSWLERSRVSMRPGAAESIEALWASIKR